MRGDPPARFSDSQWPLGTDDLGQAATGATALSAVADVWIADVWKPDVLEAKSPTSAAEI